jgi:hypothetical protein
LAAGRRTSAQRQLRLGEKKFRTLHRHNPDPAGVWPPNSPDLSPIENLWPKLWYEVATKHPKTEEEHEKACKEVFYQLEKGYIDNLLNSFRKRVELCVKARGESINGVF